MNQKNYSPPKKKLIKITSFCITEKEQVNTEKENTLINLPCDQDSNL